MALIKAASEGRVTECVALLNEGAAVDFRGYINDEVIGRVVGCG